jgi:hypothetical protein
MCSGARAPVNHLPGVLLHEGWETTSAAVPLPPVSLRHVRTLDEVSPPVAEVDLNKRRFGAALVGPGTLTERGARQMISTVREPMNRYAQLCLRVLHAIPPCRTLLFRMHRSSIFMMTGCCVARSLRPTAAGQLRSARGLLAVCADF